MVDQLNAFASEVSRVAREVGTEGKLGGQAEVLGVAGTWKALTDNVNSMASNLTAQVRNIAEVTPPSPRATCPERSPVDVQGEILELKKTRSIRWWTQLNAFASEVTRVAARSAPKASSAGRPKCPVSPAPGRRLRQRQLDGLEPPPGQVRNIADIATASPAAICRARSRSDVRAKSCSSKTPINTMVDQLQCVRGEATRVRPRGGQRTASSAARRQCRASPARGRTYRPL